jgi:hypothetical protein
VFLDDTPRIVERPLAAGWQAALFQGTGQAIAEVEAHLTR